MALQSITVLLREDWLHLRMGRPEDFGLDYHIQQDDYLRLELPDNPRIIDIFLMATKNHPQQSQIVELVAKPCMDMLMDDEPAPRWTHPIRHAPEGGLLIQLPGDPA